MWPRLTLITDPRYDDDALVSVVERVCAAVPSTCVQLRDRTANDDALVALAERLREVTRAHGALLVVNRRPELARRVGADGLHGSADEIRAAATTFAVRSAPAHDAEGVRAALAAKATAVLVSPIFASPGKGPARGVAAITIAREITGDSCAVVALGGVDETNAFSCFAAGAHGVAAIRALFEAPDPASVARRMVNGELV